MRPPVELPAAVAEMLERIENAGFPCFLVGGAVRDGLLGRPVHDFDLCSAALPGDIERLFAQNKLLLAGKKHGTVGVVSECGVVEITTFRSDGPYTDRRHPSAVSFGADISQDLSRRDFTVNAIAWSPVRGLVDPYGGEADLKARLIRAVGEPERRFAEDALRIMRCARFSARLGFDVESRTLAAALSSCGSLTGISAERIRDELSALLLSERPGEAMLRFKPIFFAILPELAPCDGFEQRNPHHDRDVLGHIAAVMDASPPRLPLRLAAMLHDVGKPRCFSFDGERGHFYGHERLSADMAREILTRLRYPGRTVRRVVRLIELHNLPPDPSPSSARKRIALAGRESIGDLLALVRSDYEGHSSLYSDRFARLDALELEIGRQLEKRNCLTLRELAINGDDLMAAGFEPGRSVGRALDTLLKAVIEGEEENKRDRLLELAVRMRDEGAGTDPAGKPPEKV